MSYDFERELGIEESLEAQGNPLRREDAAKFAGAQRHIPIGRKTAQGKAVEEPRPIPAKSFTR